MENPYETVMMQAAVPAFVRGAFKAAAAVRNVNVGVILEEVVRMNFPQFIPENNQSMPSQDNIYDGRAY